MVDIKIKQRLKKKIECDFCGSAIKVGESYVMVQSEISRDRKLNFHLGCAQRFSGELSRIVAVYVRNKLSLMKRGMV